MSLLTCGWQINCLALLIGALTICYLFLKRIFSYWDRVGFKTLPGYQYLFGHFKDVLFGKQSQPELVEWLYNSTNEPYIGIYGVTRPMLLVRDPELLRLIMIKDFNHFTDRELYIFIYFIIIY